MATRHLIIGAGPAGINAIETLRAIDSDCEITLVCDEPAYARMVLPYYLEGKVDERALMTGGDEWFSEHRVSTRLGVRVTAVDPASNQVALDDGARGIVERRALELAPTPLAEEPHRLSARSKRAC